MKKTIIFITLLINFISSSIWADATDNLKKRLDKINSFYASFTQKLIDSNGNIILEGHGDLWMKRPNLFNWHMIQPNEIILISDGENLWFYNPLVEQVTVSYLRDATNNTPFILITNNQISDWQQYTIKQIGDDFTLIPKSNNNNLKKFTINVTNNGVINRFDTVEQGGQCNTYQLKYKQNIIVDASKFIFIPRYGITIDDQRK